MIINQTGGGKKPTGTKYITTNGIHDVTDFASADVNVPTAVPTRYAEYIVDGYGNLKYSTTMPVMDFTGIKRIQDFSLAGLYSNNTVASGTITIPDIENINYNQCFYSTFSNCQGITGASLPKLTKISANNACEYMFNNCTALTWVDLSALEQISAYRGASSMFRYSGLTSIKFQSLYKISSQGLAYAFQYATSLTVVWFYAVNSSNVNSDAFGSMLYGCSNVTVHFPMSIQSTISSWYDVLSGFGGTNTTILFDIVTTLVGADTNSYTRKEKDSTGSATAWTYNSTLYYTSGNTEPVVGDTIYSDAACTTAVTTVSSLS